MPLALDPSETFPVVLPRDAAKTPTPTFRFHHLPRRERRRLQGFFDKDIEALRPDPAALERFVDDLWAFLDDVCVGWENMTRGNITTLFQPDHLDFILTDNEIWALAVEVLKGTGLTEGDRKNLPSPSPSAGASSAPAAGAAADGAADDHPTGDAAGPA